MSIISWCFANNYFCIISLHGYHKSIVGAWVFSLFSSAKNTCSIRVCGSGSYYAATTCVPPMALWLILVEHFIVSKLDCLIGTLPPKKIMLRHTASIEEPHTYHPLFNLTLNLPCRTVLLSGLPDPLPVFNAVVAKLIRNWIDTSIHK